MHRYPFARSPGVKYRPLPYTHLFGDTSSHNRYSAYPMGRLKNTVTVILRLLGVAVVLALIMLLVEVLAGVFVVEMDALFR